MIDYGFNIKLGPISDVCPDQLRKWRNHPEIYKWCRQIEPLEKWAHNAWLESLPSRRDIKMYAIQNKTGFTHVGVCGLTSIDLINRTAEFSLYIGKEHWGNGHGKEALKTLCAHGFRAFGLHHIFGETFHGNRASKTFEEVGFKLDGTRREYYYRNGEYIDAHMYSLLDREFKNIWKL